MALKKILLFWGVILKCSDLLLGVSPHGPVIVKTGDHMGCKILNRVQYPKWKVP